MLAPHRKSKSGKSQARPSLETASSSSSVEENELPIVFPSSTELFYFYGQSLEQCAKLSTGKALFDLCTLHKKWLRIYAGELDKLPPSVRFLSTRLCLPEDVLVAGLKRYVTLGHFAKFVHKPRMRKPSSS